MTLRTILLVSGQVFACAAVAWACGRLALGWLDRRLDAAGHDRFGVPERALLGGLAFFAFAIGAMVANIVTGGAVFGLPGIVPACGLVALVAAWRSNPPRMPERGTRYAPLLVLAAVLIALYAVPVFVTGSGVRTGDPPWHLGWTEQLLHGEAVPTGPAPEFGANAYPWGFHALLATMVRLVPGSDPLIAHETTHLFLIGLIPLAAACLARLANRSAGLPAAWLAGLVGGFGWLRSSAAAFIASPTEARFGGDLVAASPNSVYELFPPALPREVALVGLVGATLLMVLAARTRDTKLRFIAGAAMGAVGLMSVPMLLNAAAWSIALYAFLVRTDRLRSFLPMVGGAAVVFGLWAGPVLADFIRYDGFVNITPQLGVEWELGVALASWGILLPLAVAGIGFLLWQPPVVSRPLLACLAGSATLLGLAVARARLDWGVFGNETLLHQGRMWPPLHLVGAALGGIAVVSLYGWVRNRSRLLALSTTAVVALAGIASPVVAARGLTSLLNEHRKGFDYAEPDLLPASFVRRAAAHLSPDDVVKVEGSNELAFLLFQFSGVRLATYDDPRLIGNELRIRFSELADRWDRKALGEGFDSDYVVRPAVGSEGLEVGTFGDITWELIPSA